MTGLSDWISNFLKFTDLKLENEKVDPKNLSEESNKISQLWPRLLSFTPNPQECEDDPSAHHTGPFSSETHHSTMQNPAIVSNQKEQMPVDECEEEDTNPTYEDGCDEEGNEIPSSRRTGGLYRKLRCMFRGARYGLKEGAVSGIFFGGGYGLYKYISTKKGEESGSSEEGNGDSTVNDNMIFVTAANGAIAMAVFCMFFCSTKAAMYCT